MCLLVFLVLNVLAMLIRVSGQRGLIAEATVCMRRFQNKFRMFLARAVVVCAFAPPGKHRFLRKRRETHDTACRHVKSVPICSRRGLAAPLQRWVGQLGPWMRCAQRQKHEAPGQPRRSATCFESFTL